MDFPEVKDIMRQRDTASERIRNVKEMERFRQKMTNVRLQPEIIKKFKDLIKEDRKIMEYSNLVSYWRHLKNYFFISTFYVS